MNQYLSTGLAILALAVVLYLIYKAVFEHMTLPPVNQPDQPGAASSEDLVKKGIEQEVDLKENAASIPKPLNEIEQAYPAVYKSSKIDLGVVYDNSDYKIGENASPESLNSF